MKIVCRGVNFSRVWTTEKLRRENSQLEQNNADLLFQRFVTRKCFTRSVKTIWCSQGGRNRWSQGFTGNQSFYYREILRSWIYEGGNFFASPEKSSFRPPCWCKLIILKPNFRHFLLVYYSNKSWSYEHIGPIIYGMKKNVKS